MGGDVMGTICQRCGCDDCDVVDSRPTIMWEITTIRRRRRCKKCDHRFTTYEMSDDVLEQREMTARAEAKKLFLHFLADMK